MVTLTIDGKQVTVKEGTYVIDAAEEAGVKIPRFCYHKKLASVANCRICLVEIEGARKLMTSCSTPVTEGMVVRANNEAVKLARSEIMATLLASHPLDCPVCDQGGECDLQDYAELNTPAVGRFGDVKNKFEKKELSPLIEKELNRCVTCLRCVRYCREYMDVGALASINRGNHTEITTFMDRKLACEFCGGCIEACPVGSLTNKTIRYSFRPWQMEKHSVICEYCADGCSMVLHTKDGEHLRTTYNWDAGRNKGSLCAKGYYGLLIQTDRLTTPLAKKHKKLIIEDWKQSAGEVSEKLTSIISEHGTSAVAGFISGRALNEDIYLFQKFFREVIGTKNIDSTLRYGSINSMKATYHAFGTHKMMNSFEEIEAADNIILIGADITETNPVVGYKVRAAVKTNGATLAIVDNATSAVSRLASINIKHDLSVQAVINDLAASVCAVGASVKIDGIEKILANKRLADNGITEKIDEITKLLLAEDKKTIIIVGQKVAEDTNGYNLCLSLADIAIMAGLVKKEGSGVNFLCEETNAQGLAMFGAGPDFLPGFAPAADSAADLLTMIDEIEAGRIKAMFIVGEDIVNRLPESKRIKKALRSLDLLVVHDMFINETVELADYIFPTSGFGEKDGSYTNVEGVVQEFYAASEPLGNSKSDWEIFSLLAKTMGKPLEYTGTDDVRNEMLAQLPSENDVDSCVDKYLKSIVGVNIVGRYGSVSESASKESNSFNLIIGPVLFQSGKLTARSRVLNEIVNYPELKANSSVLSINKEDADRCNISDGEKVKLASESGSVELEVIVTSKYPPGVLFFPEHYNRPDILDILKIEKGPAFNTVSYKSTGVTLEKL